MNIKTQGIVLQSIKFTDSKRITSIFTKTYGKKSFVVYNSKQKNYSNNLFQPLTLLNIEFTAKQNQTLHNIKETSIFLPFTNVHNSISKSSIVFFLTEIIDKLIDNDFTDEALFDYIFNALILLDNSDENANFHIAFLVDLMHYFGIMPTLNHSDLLPFFDITNATFTNSFDKEISMDKNLSKKFYTLCRSGISRSNEIFLTKTERQLLVNKIIAFYSYHYKPIREMRSPAVLEYLF